MCRERTFGAFRTAASAIAGLERHHLPPAYRRASSRAPQPRPPRFSQSNFIVTFGTDCGLYSSAASLSSASTSASNALPRSMVERSRPAKGVEDFFAIFEDFFVIFEDFFVI